MEAKASHNQKKVSDTKKNCKEAPQNEKQLQSSPQPVNKLDVILKEYGITISAASHHLYTKFRVLPHTEIEVINDRICAKNRGTFPQEQLLITPDGSCILSYSIYGGF